MVLERYYAPIYHLFKYVNEEVVRFGPALEEDPTFSKTMTALEILKEAHAMELRDEREHLLAISEVIETL